MSLIKFETVTKKISSLANWLLYLLILLIFTEFVAGQALVVYRKAQRGATDYSTLDEGARRELAEVQGQAELNLYRWYSNLPNYTGEHVITDESGFRINSLKVKDQEVIGMFGGSTTFSVATSQTGTIPDQLTMHLDGKYVLNFGVGGYSTGAEIMAFVEAIRAYPQMKTAVFYDGVNELGRALERDGHPRQGPNAYDLIGAPYLAGEMNAIRHSSPGIRLTDSNIFYIFQKIQQMLQRSNGSSNQRDILGAVVERYYENIKVLSGICLVYEIECIFSWQPSIYTVSKTALSPREIEILKLTPMAVYLELTKLIFSDQRSHLYNILDLTSALDTKQPSEEYFIDWCHVTDKGNELIAHAIAKKLVSD